MRLSELHTGDRAVIVRHHAQGAFRKRILEMGFLMGKEILVVKNAPMQDPVQYRILNYDVSLRRQEAETIEVRLISPEEKYEPEIAPLDALEEEVRPTSIRPVKDPKKIKVAFVGNPNCGKTSLFNAASGANEHVGNYSGVTVEAKTAVYKQDGYTFELTDLPGTYSLSSYSLEEKYISDFLTGDEQPDVIINVVDTSNLERNLYMTTQLIETGLPMVVALNMFDEFEQSGSKLDLPMLSKLLGTPLCPTVGRTGRGLKDVFTEVIALYEKRSETRRIVEVRYKDEVEDAIRELKSEIDAHASDMDNSLRRVRSRYIAIKILEDDEALSKQMEKGAKKGGYLLTRARYLRQNYEDKYEKDTQTSITDTRYGFVSGALCETFKADFSNIVDKNRKIDHILTHKIWGFPIFIALMYIMFEATFTLGAYPMAWIEAGIEWLGSLVGTWMPDGMLKDLLIDGVIGGVGGVIVFLPNIVILYLFMSIMEDTGYMARAAFIMDRLMHLIGLHGKSFIPLVMGFGCNVPAVMATRTIESRNNRMVTMLILPFMSCSARLPVYLLLAGAFFPQSAGSVLFGMYFLGIIVAILSALMFKKFFFAQEDTPFVMELPPYRIPTTMSVLLHMWTRAKQYLNKMGTVILLASIAVWALGYFPQYEGASETQQMETYAQDHVASEVEYFGGLTEEQRESMIQQEHSYIGKIGHAIEPVFAPMGFDWRMSVALLTGAAAKEIVVSTMGVLYVGDDSNEVLLTEKLRTAKRRDGSPAYDPIIALAFMIFVLIYFPCIATIVAIGKESGSAKWAFFSMFYSLAVGWILAYACVLIGRAFF
ncbi:ferrous iron transport protein B [Porphyromonas sp.]|uniref:ferrous iron transport protein B n=1 Tax=Porphyromonas sp. TaxID=1924944 RepID=UPI0026DBD081|nr:ferrous iron transport protein B [Porphyromonas sp.]MDO4771617.1 ferrous iron transport protein B [Porphyromonas sp.]